MKKFLTTLLLLCATSYSWAQEVIDTTSEKATAEKRGRTVKIDREINNNIFVFKGESMAGLTVSYSTLESEDSNIALILTSSTCAVRYSQSNRTTVSSTATTTLSVCVLATTLPMDS